MEKIIAEKQVAVVSGATSGFGKRIIRKLAGDGWLTIGLARQEQELAVLANEVGGEFQVCDLTEPEQVEAAANHILKDHPAINLLVNSAGIPMRERYSNATPEQIKRVMDVNYFGTIALTNALMEGLEEAAPRADIINIVSAAGSITNPNSGPYGASKAAQNSWSLALMADLSGDNINVHIIHPGKADTEGFPQNNNSLIKRLMGTDVETVAKVAMRQIGRKPSEVYVPRSLKVLAIAQRILPRMVTNLVDGAVK